MASAVLAMRYSAAPGRPSSANQNSGATTESLRFSASDSMADSRTCTAVRALTSRLTKRASCARPAGSDWPSASSTASTSSCSMRQASKGLSKNASITTASQAISIKAACCSHQEIIKTIAARAIHTSAPSQKRRKSCATGVSGATRSPPQCKAVPIHTTGCQRAGGSPSHQSMASANSGTPMPTAAAGQAQVGISKKSQGVDTRARP